MFYLQNISNAHNFPSVYVKTKIECTLYIYNTKVYTGSDIHKI